MSLLQHSLHALPPGSTLYARDLASNAEHNRLLDKAIKEATAAAHRIQAETGCTWAEAVRAIVFVGGDHVGV